MPDDAPNLMTIFGEALEISDPALRTAYLDRACLANPELRARVDRLLAAHAYAGAFLEPAHTGSYAEPPAEAEPDAPASIDEFLPHLVAGTILAGKYKLLEEIGEGGMGEVWMAQQSGPIKRLVAVKVIKAGMDSKAVLARFDAERQALALMDHPNIARVLDAGSTADGRPFFVMELVKGVPITQFCDDRKLTPRQRLELFVPVCQAIQHAHQKGVIHRDVKPRNVLVALYDDLPMPKVIDFGVAKAIGQPLTEQTLNTVFGTVVGTLEYMSPEQATFNNLDIDTRSDIYSLGVLLYELLAGSPPISRWQMEKAGLLELLRVVREEEPARPSTRLSTADALPSLAASRGMEPRKLTGMLRNEVDWMVMKALEKDRRRRYESANGFAADVLRYLSGEPVQAVPPSASYRLRKFIRKHRGAVVAASMVVLALLCGIAGTTWGLIRADNRRAEAEQARANEAERVNERDLAIWMTEQEAQKARQREADAKKSEAKAVDAGRALNEANMALQVSMARTQMHEENAWKQTKDMLQVLTKVMGLMQSKRLVIDTNPEIPKLRTEVLNVVREYLASVPQKAAASNVTSADLMTAELVADMLMKLGRAEEPRQILSTASKSNAMKIAKEPNNDLTRGNQAILEQRLGEVALNMEGDARKALTHFTKCRELQEEIRLHPRSGEFKPLEIKRTLASTDVRMGRAHLALGQAVKALPFLVEALKYYTEWRDSVPKDRQTEPSGHFMEARMLLGIASSHLGDVNGVNEHFEVALGIGRELQAKYPTFFLFKIDQAEVEGNHGDALLRLGKQPEAQKQYLESLKHIKEFFAKSPDDIENQPLLALANERLGIVSSYLKQEAEAKDYYKVAMQLRKELWEIEKTNLSRQVGFVVSMARAGDIANAMRLCGTVRPRMEKSTELMLQVARCFAICARADIPEKKNNIEQALSALVAATNTDYRDAAVLLTDPDLSALREEPAFKDMIAKMRMR